MNGTGSSRDEGCAASNRGDGYIVAEGDVPKVEPTVRYFTELRASLMNGLSVAGDLAAEHRLLRSAVEQIAETARWYADNPNRLAHEVDHALCVEILSMAEEALNG